jgi:hypothetical protein
MTVERGLRLIAGVSPSGSSDRPCRDRTAARATLGGEFPPLALSMRELGSSFHHGPRFRRPPGDPGRSDGPSPVLTLACPPAAFPTPEKLKC